MSSPPPTARWTVRPYQRGDEAAITALYWQVTGRERPAAVWEWKFRAGLDAGDTLWLAVTDDGQVVGQYGGWPVGLCSGGRTLRAIHAGEGMTHPTYQRQGVMTAVGQAAHAAWAAAGVEAVIGLPNERWGTRMLALGYRNLIPVQVGWLRLPLHPQRVLARRGALPGPVQAVAGGALAVGAALWRGLTLGTMRPGPQANIRVEAIHASSAVFDQIWAGAAPHYPNCGVRDAAWMQWRYFEPPEPTYQVLVAHTPAGPAGYVAIRLPTNADSTTGYLADLFCAPTDRAVAAALVGAAVGTLAAAGAAMVIASGVPGSALYRHLRRMGFWPQPIGYDLHLASFTADLDPTRLTDPRTWHFTAGDSDVI